MKLQFNLLWNNIMSNQAPGLTDYEISQFLTQAEKSIVIALYNGTAVDSFEETEEVTDYLAPLVRQVTMDSETEDNVPHIVSGSQVFKIDESNGRLLARTYESCTLAGFSCGDPTRQIVVVPVTQDEYWRTSRDPFRGPNARRVLRLAYDKYNAPDGAENSSVSKYSELICANGYTVQSYTVRYIAFPPPIIISDLAYNLTIDGENKKMECILNPQIHDRIVLEAVNTAKSVWS